MNTETTSPSTSPTRSALWLALLFVFIAFLRITAQSDLHEGDQPKQMDYVLDIVCNGNWTVQHHADGSIMSKPPLYNWLAAPFVMLFGGEDVFLKMPSLFGGLAALLMVWDLARRRVGDRAAFWGATFMLLTSMYTKQLYFARTDMLLTCFIVAQFWAVIRWEDSGCEKPSFRSGWVWIFWTAAALGNLTKGPLAFLPHLALAGYWWLDGDLKDRYTRLGVWWGLPLAWLPLLIWFGCAYRSEGYAVYEHMVKAEVVARFQSDADRAGLKGTDKSNRNFFYYIPHLISRAAPWSLFGLLGIWGIFTAKKNPSVNDRERRMLHFLAAWFFTTLLFFSLVPSKRADRIFPAIPAFCLLAGWVFDGMLKWLEGKTADRIEHRISRWIVMTLAITFLLACILLEGLGKKDQIGVFKGIQHAFPNITPDTVNPWLDLWFWCWFFLAYNAGILIYITAKKRTEKMAFPLLFCNLLVIVLYQSFFGSWMLTDISAGEPIVCREVRARARTENVPVMLLHGSSPVCRLYLLKAGLPTSAVKAVELLAQPHPAMYVVGTRSSRVGQKTVAGGLIDAGLGDVKPLDIKGIPPPENEDAKLPAIPWLGAVYVPERK